MAGHMDLIPQSFILVTGEKGLSFFWAPTPFSATLSQSSILIGCYVAFHLFFMSMSIVDSACCIYLFIPDRRGIERELSWHVTLKYRM